MESRSDFEAKGVTLAAVSSQAQGAEDFRAAAWPAPVYLDEADAFKQALGSPNFSNWWLLKPSVIRGIISGSKYGTDMSDLNAKTSVMGGVILVGPSGVAFSRVEGSEFQMPAAAEILSALG